jgi:hypothetical protein
VSDLEEVGLAVSALSYVGEEFRKEPFSVRTNRKNVVLMNAEIQLAPPDEAAAEFVVLCPPFRETVGANPLGTCRYDIEHFAAVLHW